MQNPEDSYPEFGEWKDDLKPKQVILSENIEIELLDQEIEDMSFDRPHPD